MLDVERWAEIRRMARVEGLSGREISRRTGIHRTTIAKALASDEPPSYGPRPGLPSKVDPFEDEICARLAADPRISSQRLREICTELGYEGAKTIFDERVRELRPRFLPPPRTFQRTIYQPGELAQFDLCEPRAEIPVGFGQARRGYVVTCKLPYSRAFQGALIFQKRWEDIAFGMSRCLRRLGALPERLVWDREGAVAPQGRPTDEFLAFCGQLSVGWIVLDAGDCQAKGSLERDHRYFHGNFEAGRSFANELDFQDQLDRWSERANRRKHRSTRALVSERLASERERMRPLPDPTPRTDHRFTLRVPPQPYFRFDRNDYSLDPRLVGRRVEVRAGQRAIVAVSLDDGEIVAKHRRVFASGLTFTDPAHQRALEELRGERKRRRAEPEVEIRPLARYDQLIPA